MNTKTVRNTSGGFTASTTVAFCGFTYDACEMTMWRNIPWKSFESGQNKCHTTFPTAIFWFYSFYVPYCSLFFINAQSLGCLSFNIIFCWIFSFHSSDITLMLLLTNSSLPTSTTQGWYHHAQIRWVQVRQPLSTAAGPHEWAATTTGSMLFAQMGAPKGHVECTNY